MINFLLLLLSSLLTYAHNLETDTIVVVGKKEQSTSKLDKASVVKKEVISKSEILHKNATSLAKAVDLEPGVQTTLTCANCGSQRITLNGLRGENTTVLIDGIPAFSSVSSFYGMEAIPMAGVASIEIMRGAGASLTAPESIGGAINIVTTPGNEKRFVYQIKGGNHQFLNQEFLGSYGNAKGGTVIAAQTNLLGSFDEDKNNIAESSRQSQRSVFIKQENRLGDQFKFSLRGGLQDLELIGGATNAHRVTQYPSDIDTLEDFGASRDIRNPYTGNLNKISDRIRLNRLDTGGSLTFSPSSEMDIKASFALAKQTQKSIYSHGYDYNNEDMFRFFDVKINALLNESHFLTVGVDHRNEDMNSSSDFLYGLMDYKKDSFSFKTLGFYIQDEWYLSERDELNLILRVDKLKVNWHDPRLMHGQLNETAIAPRIHYKHSHNDEYSSRIAYGVGYRAPLSMFESQHGTNEEGFELNITKLERAHNLTYTLNRTTSVSESAVSFAWTRLEHMAYANEESSPVLFENSSEKMDIKTFGLLHIHRLTADWSLEGSFDWFIMPDNYKNKLPTAAQETRARIISDFHYGSQEFVTTLNVVGSRNLSPYGYHKNYNTLMDDPDPMSFDKIPANQKRQRSPLFYTIDLFYQKQFKKFSWMAGINNVLDYTQTKKAESPLSWRTHMNHAHLDNRHIWGPNTGRTIYTGLRIDL